MIVVTFLTAKSQALTNVYTHEVFGMGNDLALVLSVYDALINGLSCLYLSQLAKVRIPSSALLFQVLVKGLRALITTTRQTCLQREGTYPDSRRSLNRDYHLYLISSPHCDNSHDIQMSQFLQLYNLQSHITEPSEVNSTFRLSRLKQSI
ncbi:hypothetical protein F5050DRAFT_127997 [Lentinula boryana]|uniref:Uncharacterized protein n=1 Tax=Lentinula boryana TaxID=40481 RepID=A0ABQ8QCT1_9AGAR|nr:hypothetical protein F5050DRAFT_127997 [Lentinula boryana]